MYQFEDFELDTLRFELRRAGRLIPTPRLVFDLIVHLLTHRDRPVTKAELFSHVWPGRAVTEASLTQAITAARRAVGDNASEQRVIRTVNGRGYWWVADTWMGHRTEPGRRGDAFVGRVDELALAIETLGTVSEGMSLLIRVVGEAGIGKTRFADEVAASARGRGFTILRGRCAETHGEAAESPWHSVVAQAMAQSGNAGRALGTRSRLDLIEQVSLAVRPHVERAPTLVVLDDVHRMDRLSLRLARSVLRDPSLSRLALLITHREPLDPVATDAMHELASAAPARTIELMPLGLSEIKDLAERLTSGAAHPDPVLVYERSGGNPFFATELIRGMQNDSAGSDVHFDSSRLPCTIRDAVNEQTERLSHEATQLLRTASVVGREFDASLLVELTEFSATRALGVIDELSSRRLVEEAPDRPGVFRFRHLLVRDAVYAQLGCAERGGLHLAVAAALRRRYGLAVGPQLLPLAHHMRSALPLADPSEVAEICLRAARYATQTLEPEAAIECCREAIELLQTLSHLPLESRVDLSIALAIAEMRCGLRREGKLTLKRIQADPAVAAEPELVARAALSLAPGFFSIETGIVDWDLIATLEQALGTLPVSDSVIRVRLLGSLAQALYWSEDRTRVEALARDGWGTATRLGDPSGLAYAALARFSALWGPGNLEERQRVAERLQSISTGVCDPEVEMMSGVFVLTTLLELGHRRRASLELGGLRRMVLNRECLHGRWYPPMYDAMFAIAAGRFADAEALIKTYHQIGQRLDDANVSQTSLLQMTEILWQTGRAAAVVGAVEENIEKHPALHEWQGALVFLNARAGRVREARHGLTALAGMPLPGLSYRMNAAIGVCALAEAAWLLEDADAASKLRLVVERWGERIVVAGYGVLCWGSTARGRGHLASVLGETDEAEFWYRRALVLEGRARTQVWRARTQLAYSRLLRSRSAPGDGTRADRLLSQVRRFAGMRGLSALAEEAAAETRRHR